MVELWKPSCSSRSCRVETRVVRMLSWVKPYSASWSRRVVCTFRKSALTECSLPSLVLFGTKSWRILSVIPFRRNLNPSSEDIYPAAPEPTIRLLSVFDDRQLVTGLPGMIVRRARELGNSTVTQGTSDLYWFGLSWSSKSLTSSQRYPLRRIDCMIVCTKDAPSLSLYMERKLRCNSSHSRIQLRSSRSTTESNFSNILTRSVFTVWSPRHLSSCPSKLTMGPCIEVDLIQNPVDPVSIATVAVESHCNMYDTRSTYKTFILNFCNMRLKKDKILETCIWNTCKNT
jgi:hypothetical protein